MGIAGRHLFSLFVSLSLVIFPACGAKKANQASSGTFLNGTNTGSGGITLPPDFNMTGLSGEETLNQVNDDPPPTNSSGQVLGSASGNGVGSLPDLPELNPAAPWFQELDMTWLEALLDWDPSQFFPEDLEDILAQIPPGIPGVPMRQIASLLFRKEGRFKQSISLDPWYLNKEHTLTAASGPGHCVDTIFLVTVEKDGSEYAIPCSKTRRGPEDAAPSCYGDLFRVKRKNALNRILTRESIRHLPQASDQIMRNSKLVMRWLYTGGGFCSPWKNVSAMAARGKRPRARLMVFYGQNEP